MTDIAMIETAMGSIKAHGIAYKELHALLGEGDNKTVVQVINGCAQLLRELGHNTCAIALLNMLVKAEA